MKEPFFGDRNDLFMKSQVRTKDDPGLFFVPAARFIDDLRNMLRYMPPREQKIRQNTHFPRPFSDTRVDRFRDRGRVDLKIRAHDGAKFSAAADPRDEFLEILVKSISFTAVTDDHRRFF